MRAVSQEIGVAGLTLQEVDPTAVTVLSRRAPDHTGRHRVVVASLPTETEETLLVALERVRDAASIVLVGSLNPAIFHPAWFASRGLIQKTEEEGAKIEHVTPQISTFKAGWLSVQVVQNRFFAWTEDADNFPLLRDLALGTFQLLEHTPAQKLGLNRELRFDLATEDQWHHVGHALVPKTIWRRYTDSPGMKLLTVHSKRKDDMKGEVNVSVRPAVMPARKYCVQVEINSHFDLEDGAVGLDAVKIFANHFDKAMANAELLAVGVINDALTEKVP